MSQARSVSHAKPYWKAGLLKKRWNVIDDREVDREEAAGGVVVDRRTAANDEILNNKNALLARAFFLPVVRHSQFH
jgi:hypothetical protein